MYCKAAQSSEEEMYNNEEAGPAFTEFLETIGKKIRLNGFAKYKAGLDNKCNYQVNDVAFFIRFTHTSVI